MRKEHAAGGLVGLLIVAVVGGVVSTPHAGSVAPAKWETRRDAPTERTARRRWALARMDEMAQERQRCRERFKASRQIADCEADFARRYRQYNEIYIEAARD